MKKLLFILITLPLIGFTQENKVKKSNYFDVPYKHYDSGLISTSSYTPFLLLAVIIPVSLFTIKRLKSVKTKSWIKATLVSNNLIYLILILSFGYWGLYSIWN